MRLTILLLAVLLGCAVADPVGKGKNSDGNRPMPKDKPGPREEGEDGSPRVRRSGNCITPNLWPNGQVCNYLNANFEDSKMEVSLGSAIKAIQDATCLTFDLEMSHDKCTIVDAEPDQVKQGDSGCWANIGCSDQHSLTLNLPTSCDIYGDGVVIHELMHVLGRYHEHTRQDRDAKVRVMSDNIRSGSEHNFEKCDRELYGIEYDYESIMHYGTHFFAEDRSQPTLEILDPNFVGKVGRQDKMSPLDVLTINKMYKCYEKAGISDPFDCERGGIKQYNGNCYCVEPFEGDNCQSIASGVAHIENSGTEETVHSKNYPKNYPLNSVEVFALECTDKTKKAHFHFDEFQVEAYSCGYDKYKYSNNAADVNPKIACDGQLKGKDIESLDNIIVMKLISDDMYTYKGFSGKFTCK